MVEAIDSIFIKSKPIVFAICIFYAYAMISICLAMKIWFLIKYDRKQKRCWLEIPMTGDIISCLFLFFILLTAQLIGIYWLNCPDKLDIYQLMEIKIQTLTLMDNIYLINILTILGMLFPTIITPEYINIGCGSQYHKEEIVFQYDHKRITLYSENKKILKIRKGKKYAAALEILIQNYNLKE